MGINYFRRDGRDTKFVLFEHMGVDRILGYEPYKDFSADDFKMIIDEALKVCREVVGPTMQDSDRQGCRYEDGRVIVPESYHECWKLLAENGWMATTKSLEFGGQGLPAIVGGLIGEFFTGSNMAFMTFPGLAVGNGHLIENFGTEEDKALFVEKMYTGVWGGTMCLTEPDAGSDVGYLRAKATPDPDSDNPRIYKIEGTKRFITCGDHNITENIIHLLLARIQGAPMGTKGISLFIVPKIWVNPDGSLGEPNDVFCAGIEHKMGIHGSSTCTLNFGENGRCRGILLGEPNSGMAKMFQMMNEARIGCGIQALGIAASAYDAARYYAKERVQGPPFTDRAADRVPIIKHEDVRRMLMNMKSGIEAMRAFVAKLLYLADVAEHDPDPETRKNAAQRVELLTPLVKAYNSDLGYLLTREAIQVLGGVGYCSEFPAEQYARDIKIVSIWEGTSYIQSLDLIGRKLGMGGGKVFQGWIQEVMAFSGKNKDDSELSRDFKLLYKAAQATGDIAMKYMQYFQEGKMSLIPLSSVRFLECFAETVMAHLMLEQGLIARDKLGKVDAESADGIFYKGKLETAKFFCRNILTNVFSRYTAIQQEDTSAVDIPEGAF
ncbi:MAG: acyl-CoA dehydrogenase [Desulfobacteraceae bacterium]|jgi:alkylation response protein AidB-like acyl-CoA dehydrogenase|nr:MAG: acyl-CoA dehydrogenase [Desulfobacteraceae bacterium]